MTKSRVLIGLGVASVLWVVAAMRWRVALPPIQSATSNLPPLAKPPAALADSALAESAAMLVDNDPFRVANEPAAVRYDSRVDGSGSVSGGVAAVSAPPPLRPNFVLRAIVGGPPWQAIVDGFPGQPAGAIVQKGSEIARIAVTAVNRDSVLLRGPDTAWVLTFRRRQ